MTREVTIYADWYSQEILSEQSFKDKITEAIEDRPYSNDDFDNWLCANFTSTEIFKMSSERREEVFNEFEEYWSREIRDEIEMEYEKITLEVEVTVDNRVLLIF